MFLKNDPDKNVYFGPTSSVCDMHPAIGYLHVLHAMIASTLSRVSLSDYSSIDHPLSRMVSMTCILLLGCIFVVLSQN